MTNEQLLKDYILTKYKSLREFSIKNGIPYSTVSNIFNRGLMNSGVSLILNVCHILNIDLESLVAGKIVEKNLTSEELTPKESLVASAYRNNREMQPAVDRLLNISDSTIEQDIADTVMAEKNTVSN